MSTVESLVDSGKFSWCHPTSKGDLLLEYPQLRQYDAFTALDNPRKMLFVWFYACKASRARELPDDKDRIRYALIGAWGKQWPKDVNGYLDKKWGAEVTAAIAVMRGVEPGPLIMRKVWAAKEIDVTREQLEKTPKADMEWEEQIQYYKAKEAGSKYLDSLLLIAQEGSSGVVEKTEEMEEEEGAIMELLHQMRSGS